MNKRPYMESMVLGSLAAAALLALGASERKPNLLFIMTDQQRWDAMTCAGNGVLKTPNMDRITREGVMFANAHTAQPICVPARAILLTGLSAVNVGGEGNGDYERKDVADAPTFDNILKQHGYVAEYYGKLRRPRTAALMRYTISKPILLRCAT